MQIDKVWSANGTLPVGYTSIFPFVMNKSYLSMYDKTKTMNNGYKGKFTARGHSIDRYLDLIQSVRQDYADTITHLEDEINGPLSDFNAM